MALLASPAGHPPPPPPRRRSASRGPARSAPPPPPRRQASSASLSASQICLSPPRPTREQFLLASSPLSPGAAHAYGLGSALTAAGRGPAPTARLPRARLRPASQGAGEGDGRATAGERCRPSRIAAPTSSPALWSTPPCGGSGTGSSSRSSGSRASSAHSNRSACRMVLETDATFSVVHLRDLVARDGYLSRFLPLDDGGHRIVEAKVLHRFLVVHMDLTDILAGNVQGDASTWAEFLAAHGIGRSSPCLPREGGSMVTVMAFRSRFYIKEFATMAADVSSVVFVRPHQ